MARHGSAVVLLIVVLCSTRGDAQHNASQGVNITAGLLAHSRQDPPLVPSMLFTYAWRKERRLRLFDTRSSALDRLSIEVAPIVTHLG